MRTTTKAKIGLAGLGTVALTLAATLPAYADYAPGPSDIVGVGGDTPQFDLAFGADGDVAGDAGFNTSHPTNRLVSFNATADGNARAAYVSGTANNLNPTDVLRAGTKPVQRIQSSGNPITAMLADTTKPYTINYVFSASEPTAAQEAQANDATHNWGYLHVVKIGKDGVVAAAAATTNAPAGLSVNELLSIYEGTVTKWNQLPGNTAGSSDTIVPELPPSSSSITKTFLSDLALAKGSAVTLGNPNIVTVEQNDPSAITGSAHSADAILPFSSARLTLDDSGYFRDPSVAFPGGAGVVSTVKALTGTSTDAKAAYNSEVDHYVIYRQSDTTITSPMEPGGTENWVYTLFSKAPGANAPTPFFDTAAGQADIAAAGTTPSYQDIGNPSSG